MNGRLVLAGAAVAVLLAAHVLVFGFAIGRLALPVAAAIGLAVLAIAKHLGLLASLAAWARRRLTPRS